MFCIFCGICVILCVFYCFCSIVLYVFLLCCVVCRFTLANKPLITIDGSTKNTQQYKIKNIHK